MKVSLFKHINSVWEEHPSKTFCNCNAVGLILCFGEKKLLAESDIYNAIKSKFSNAQIAMCSTAGEIFNTNVLDGIITVVAFEFNTTSICTSSVNIKEYTNSYEAGKTLVKNLTLDGLKYLLILCDGTLVNGSELVKGLTDVTNNTILITGGLAGDNFDFKSTLVGLNNHPTAGTIVAIGFYGEKLVVTHGSLGGWEMFGPERVITKSTHNILYEIDNKNALDLYKKYLGPDVENLPSSALLYPLAVMTSEYGHPVVRTILDVNEQDKTMTFAGDVPQGSKVRLMKANLDKLTMASQIASDFATNHHKITPVFALLISCVGRRLVLGSRIEEEIEAAFEVMGSETLLAGFYSYGEISPLNGSVKCELQNQTMTITSFYVLP
jgi:hypothetical protein